MGGKVPSLQIAEPGQRGWPLLSEQIEATSGGGGSVYEKKD